MLSRALLFLGSTFHTAIFLVAISRASEQRQLLRPGRQQKAQVKVITEYSVPCKGRSLWLGFASLDRHGSAGGGPGMPSGAD